MSRLLFWIAFIILVVMAIRAKLRESTGARQPQPPAPNPPPVQVAESERMACCAECGVYFPASEAVRYDGRDYCCPAHVRVPAK
jgi:uncharacterized protein